MAGSRQYHNLNNADAFMVAWVSGVAYNSLERKYVVPLVVIHKSNGINTTYYFNNEDSYNGSREAYEAYLKRRDPKSNIIAIRTSGGDMFTVITETSGVEGDYSPINLNVSWVYKEANIKNARAPIINNIPRIDSGSGSGTVTNELNCGDVSCPPEPKAITVTSMTPFVINAVGGTTITITGSNFPANPVVLIGNVPAVIVSNTSSQIIITSPVVTPGIVSISITDGNPPSPPDYIPYYSPNAFDAS